MKPADEAFNKLKAIIDGHGISTTSSAAGTMHEHVAITEDVQAYVKHAAVEKALKDTMQCFWDTEKQIFHSKTEACSKALELLDAAIKPVLRSVWNQVWEKDLWSRFVEKLRNKRYKAQGAAARAFMITERARWPLRPEKKMLCGSQTAI
jgi:hypothetical protein